MCNTQEKQEKRKAPQGKAAFFEKKAKNKNKGQFADKRQEKRKNAGKRQEKIEKGHAGADQGREIRTADRSGQSCTSATRQADPIRARHPLPRRQNWKADTQAERGADAEKGAGHKEHFAGGGNAKRCGAAKSAGVYCRPAKRATVQNGGAQSKSRPQFEVIEGGRSGERHARDKAPRQQDPGREGKT